MKHSEINFIQNRSKFFGVGVNPNKRPNFKLPKFFAFRSSPSVLVGAFLVLAGLGAGVFYLLKFQGIGPFAEKPESQGQVAGIACKSGKLPKDWLLKYFNTDNECDPAVGGAEGDPDSDSLLNQEELLFASNPTNPDTDGDGEMDGAEVLFNRNPNGEGELNIVEDSAATDDYLKSLGPEYEKFTEANIRKDLEAMFQPNREIVLDPPDDKELIITNQNDRAGFEKYYEDTKDLKYADEVELVKVYNSLFALSPEELNQFIDKLRAVETILKQTPVPSTIVDIHRLRIAQLRTGIRMYELVRDNYEPNSPNSQFWADYFYQVVAVEEATTLEIIAWKEMFDMLKAQGGL